MKRISKIKNVKNPVLKKWYSLNIEENVRDIGGIELGDFVAAIDIIKHGNGKYDWWEVTVRYDRFERKDYDTKIGSFCYLKNAKKFAKAYADFLADADKPCPNQHDENFKESWEYDCDAIIAKA